MDSRAAVVLNRAPDWLCAAVSPLSRLLGLLIFGDARPLCAIAWDRCGRERWAWHFVQIVGAQHASESFEAWPHGRAQLLLSDLPGQEKRG